jgi:hypothetical protein
MKTPILYTLMDGEAQNQAHPTTFNIPTKEERLNLRPSDLAKIVFCPPSGQGYSERMWIKIIEVPEPGKYKGTLDNDPTNPNLGLHFESKVEFEARHVIQLQVVC